MKHFNKYSAPVLVASIFAWLILYFIPTSSIGQGTQFQRSFGTTSATATEGCYSVLQATDGDYVLMGYTSSCGGGDMMLLKIGSAGGPYKWAVAYGVGTYNDQTTNTAGRLSGSVSQATDGGFILAGFYPNTFFSTPGQEMYFLKLSATDAFRWERTYGSNKDISGAGDYATDAGMTARITTDGGVIVAGYGEGGNTGSNIYDHEIDLVKVSSTGAAQWTLMFGTSNTGNENNGADVEQTTDGGYIVVGSTTTSAGGGSDVYLAKVPFAGTSVSWGRRLGSAVNDWDEAYVVHQTTDGGYIILSNGGATAGAMALVKVTNAGTTTSWSKNYVVTGGSATNGNNVIQTNDGGFVITGGTTIGGNHDFFLVKTNYLGAVQWSMKYGGSNSEEAFTVKQTSDGGYVMAGTGVVTGFGTDMYIVKTLSDGSSGSNEGAITVTASAAGYGNVAETPNHIVTLSSSGLSTTAHTFSSSQIGGKGANGVVLPVKLLSFAGRYQNKKVVLDWATASEFNNDYFTIERETAQGSDDWEEIGKVDGAGNSNYTHHYSFTDNNLPTTQNDATLLYRLKQMDYNGDFQYHEPVAVKIGSEDDIMIHTSATNEQLLVSFPDNLEGKNCSVRVYDMSGKVLFSSSFLSGKSKKDMWVDGSNWNTGVYIISACSENGNSQQKKFVKQ